MIKLGDMTMVVCDADGETVLIDGITRDPVTVKWGLIRQLESYVGGEAVECMALALKLRQSPTELEDAEMALLRKAIEANGRRFVAVMQAPLLRFVRQIEDSSSRTPSGVPALTK